MPQQAHIEFYPAAAGIRFRIQVVILFEFEIIAAAFRALAVPHFYRLVCHFIDFLQSTETP